MSALMDESLYREASSLADFLKEIGVKDPVVIGLSFHDFEIVADLVGMEIRSLGKSATEFQIDGITIRRLSLAVEAKLFGNAA